jgi:hypothetical protein
LGHGVRFALGRAAAVRAGGIDPFVHVGERALTVVRSLVAFYVGQTQGQLAVRQRYPAALFTVDQRVGSPQ